ncbi:hypothetical protein NWP22_03195 [Anabaenopsis tanganyikae CS-531]|uniref:Transposase n=2 Tax=Anabaenopsis TaxID=110103 RepID=A0ABT6KB17_9CYAN|nr:MULTISPECIES: hypothetical protein [Anabaenopsis]MDB9539170.1 hypothetical protein [Anabaenopsis arnoldii]MDH6091458.1 hypothetical protein [Anabaenopsis arnoldii]MDH6104887.1 hypothetical protein [Anabaenopsis tanganyikae CS-531]
MLIPLPSQQRLILEAGKPINIQNISSENAEDRKMRKRDKKEYRP